MRPLSRVLVSLGIMLLLATLLASIGCVTAETTRDTTIPTAETNPGTAEATAPTVSAPAPVPTQEAPQQTAPELKSATVVRVVDGDTAHLRLPDGSVEKVRFIGVDTPESTTKQEPYGSEASGYTKRVLKPGRKIFLETDAELRDRYGRLLAYIWLSKPTEFDDWDRPTLAEATKRMFNAQLMRDGYAQVMSIPPNIQYQDYFLELQREARNADRGLWSLGGSGAAPTPPPSNARGGGGSYIGNRNTMRFHLPNCSSVGQMNPANKVALKSRSAAISGGYVPCRRCNP